MNDSFNIVIDSEDSYEGTRNNTKKYTFDFSLMGEDVWEMRFYFRTQLGNNVSPAEDSALISIPEFNFVNHFRVGGDTIRAQSSKRIGMTKLDVINGVTYCHADFNDNPCVLVIQPSSHIFTIQIFNIQGAANPHST